MYNIYIHIYINKYLCFKLYKIHIYINIFFQIYYCLGVYKKTY